VHAQDRVVGAVELGDHPQPFVPLAELAQDPDPFEQGGRTGRIPRGQQHERAGEQVRRPVRVAPQHRP
jgi:hypothetical protein